MYTIDRLESAVNNHTVPEKHLTRMSQRYSDIVSDPDLLADTIRWVEKFPREIVSEGYYSHDSNIYRVRTSKRSNKRYAMKLTGKRFEYAPGAVYKLTAQDRLTTAQAAEYGRRTGQCAICGRTLTNADSVARGIGPVCLERIG